MVCEAYDTFGAVAGSNVADSVERPDAEHLFAASHVVPNKRLPRRNTAVTASCLDNRSRGPTQSCQPQSTILIFLALVEFISIFLEKTSLLKKSGSA